ncbi:unnamed protein product, partial [Urochloa humidicola]
PATSPYAAPDPDATSPLRHFTPPLPPSRSLRRQVRCWESPLLSLPDPAAAAAPPPPPSLSLPQIQTRGLTRVGRYGRGWSGLGDGGAASEGPLGFAMYRAGEQQRAGGGCESFLFLDLRRRCCGACSCR